MNKVTKKQLLSINTTIVVQCDYLSEILSEETLNKKQTEHVQEVL